MSIGGVDRSGDIGGVDRTTNEPATAPASSPDEPGACDATGRYTPRGASGNIFSSQLAALLGAADLVAPAPVARGRQLVADALKSGDQGALAAALGSSDPQVAQDAAAALNEAMASDPTGKARNLAYQALDSARSGGASSALAAALGAESGGPLLHAANGILQRDLEVSGQQAVDARARTGACLVAAFGATGSASDNALRFARDRSALAPDMERAIKRIFPAKRAEDAPAAARTLARMLDASVDGRPVASVRNAAVAALLDGLGSKDSGAQAQAAKALIAALGDPGAGPVALDLLRKNPTALASAADALAAAAATASPAARKLLASSLGAGKDTPPLAPRLFAASLGDGSAALALLQLPKTEMPDRAKIEIAGSLAQLKGGIDGKAALPLLQKDVLPEQAQLAIVRAAADPVHGLDTGAALTLLDKGGLPASVQKALVSVLADPKRRLDTASLHDLDVITAKPGGAVGAEIGKVVKSRRAELIRVVGTGNDRNFAVAKLLQDATSLAAAKKLVSTNAAAMDTLSTLAAALPDDDVEAFLDKTIQGGGEMRSAVLAVLDSAAFDAKLDPGTRMASGDILVADIAKRPQPTSSADIAKLGQLTKALIVPSLANQYVPGLPESWKLLEKLSTNDATKTDAVAALRGAVQDVFTREPADEDTRTARLKLAPTAQRFQVDQPLLGRSAALDAIRSDAGAHPKEAAAALAGLIQQGGGQDLLDALGNADGQRQLGPLLEDPAVQAALGKMRIDADKQAVAQLAIVRQRAGDPPNLNTLLAARPAAMTLGSSPDGGVQDTAAAFLNEVDSTVNRTSQQLASVVAKHCDAVDAAQSARDPGKLLAALTVLAQDMASVRALGGVYPKILDGIASANPDIASTLKEALFVGSLPKADRGTGSIALLEINERSSSWERSAILDGYVLPRVSAYVQEFPDGGKPDSPLFPAGLLWRGGVDATAASELAKQMKAYANDWRLDFVPTNAGGEVGKAAVRLESGVQRGRSALTTLMLRRADLFRSGQTAEAAKLDLKIEEQSKDLSRAVDDARRAFTEGADQVAEVAERCEHIAEVVSAVAEAAGAVLGGTAAVTEIMEGASKLAIGEVTSVAASAFLKDLGKAAIINTVGGLARNAIEIATGRGDAISATGTGAEMAKFAVPERFAGGFEVAGLLGNVYDGFKALTELKKVIEESVR